MLYPLSYRRLSLPTSRTLLSVRSGDKSNPRDDAHRAGVPADDGAPALCALLRQRCSHHGQRAAHPALEEFSPSSEAPSTA